jgi:hypothetical protein
MVPKMVRWFVERDAGQSASLPIFDNEQRSEEMSGILKAKGKKVLFVVLLTMIFSISSTTALGMETLTQTEEGPVPQIPTLHPDDAKIRNFERWKPTWTNRGNYYNWYRARKDFNGDRILFWASGLSIFEKRGKIVSDPLQGKVLRVKYPAGKFRSKDSGVTFPWILRGKYEELTLSYKVKFQADFQFVTSGKLPGLCGATDEIGCFRYSGGNPPNGDDGFSVRVVWLHGDGTLGTYVYHANQKSTYGDVFQWRHTNGEAVKVVPGQWHTIQLRVVLNDPGVANGYAEAWLDGEFVSRAEGLLFRNNTASGRSIKINEMYFVTFHGGNKSSDAPSQTQYAYFDDFQLSIYQALPAMDLVPSNEPIDAKEHQSVD